MRNAPLVKIVGFGCCNLAGFAAVQIRLVVDLGIAAAVAAGSFGFVAGFDCLDCCLAYQKPDQLLNR